MRLAPIFLPDPSPCPVCDRTAEDGPLTAARIAEHNVRCAQTGERSYTRTGRVLGALALVALLAGCGRIPTAVSCWDDPKAVVDTARFVDPATPDTLLIPTCARGFA